MATRSPASKAARNASRNPPDEPVVTTTSSAVDVEAVRCGRSAPAIAGPQLGDAERDGVAEHVALQRGRPPRRARAAGAGRGRLAGGEVDQVAVGALPLAGGGPDVHDVEGRDRRAGGLVQGRDGYRLTPLNIGVTVAAAHPAGMRISGRRLRFESAGDASCAFRTLASPSRQGSGDGALVTGAVSGLPAFGPYRVHELLGRGGMGVVHRAYDTVHHRMIAAQAPLIDGGRRRLPREIPNGSPVSPPACAIPTSSRSRPSGRSTDSSTWT